MGAFFSMDNSLLTDSTKKFVRSLLFDAHKSVNTVHVNQIARSGVRVVKLGSIITRIK